MSNLLQKLRANSARALQSAKPAAQKPAAQKPARRKRAPLYIESAARAALADVKAVCALLVAIASAIRPVVRPSAARVSRLADCYARFAPAPSRNRHSTAPDAAAQVFGIVSQFVPTDEDTAKDIAKRNVTAQSADEFYAEIYSAVHEGYANFSDILLYFSAMQSFRPARKYADWQLRLLNIPGAGGDNDEFGSVKASYSNPKIRGKRMTMESGTDTEEFIRQIGIGEEEESPTRIEDSPEAQEAIKHNRTSGRRKMPDFVESPGFYKRTKDDIVARESKENKRARKLAEKTYNR